MTCDDVVVPGSAVSAVMAPVTRIAVRCVRREKLNRLPGLGCRPARDEE
jgi:hypothetical protein